MANNKNFKFEGPLFEVSGNYIDGHYTTEDLVVTSGNVVSSDITIIPVNKKTDMVDDNDTSKFKFEWDKEITDSVASIKPTINIPMVTPHFSQGTIGTPINWDLIDENTPLNVLEIVKNEDDTNYLADYKVNFNPIVQTSRWYAGADLVLNGTSIDKNGNNPNEIIYNASLGDIYLNEDGSIFNCKSGVQILKKEGSDQQFPEDMPGVSAQDYDTNGVNVYDSDTQTTYTYFYPLLDIKWDYVRNIVGQSSTWYTGLQLIKDNPQNNATIDSSINTLSEIEPVILNATIGNMYLNKNTNDVFRCITDDLITDNNINDIKNSIKNKWSYETNIKGISGADSNLWETLNLTNWYWNEATSEYIADKNNNINYYIDSVEQSPTTGGSYLSIKNKPTSILLPFSEENNNVNDAFISASNVYTTVPDPTPEKPDQIKKEYILDYLTEYIDNYADDIIIVGPDSPTSPITKLWIKRNTQGGN